MKHILFLMVLLPSFCFGSNYICKTSTSTGFAKVQGNWKQVLHAEGVYYLLEPLENDKNTLVLFLEGSKKSPIAVCKNPFTDKKMLRCDTYNGGHFILNKNSLRYTLTFMEGFHLGSDTKEEKDYGPAIEIGICSKEVIFD